MSSLKNNKTALDLDSAQNQAIFKLYHQCDHDHLCPSGKRLMAMICTFSTFEESKSTQGAWKQMNEALMLSPRWASVSTAAARLKQCVGKMG